MGEACISSLISSSSTRVINIIIATDRKYDKCNTGGQVQLFAVQRNSHFFNGSDVDDVADDDGGEKHEQKMKL